MDVDVCMYVCVYGCMDGCMYNIGDKIVYLGDSCDEFTYGNIYEVLMMSSNYYYLSNDNNNSDNNNSTYLHIYRPEKSFTTLEQRREILLKKLIK